MKMTAEHYKFIKEQLQQIPVSDIHEHLKALQQARKDKAQRIKDMDMRIRWDSFYARQLSAFACSHLYSYLNDTHIDTALKQIARELSWPTEK